MEIIVRLSTVYAFLTIEKWCLNWTGFRSRAIVFAQNLIQWLINNQSLCHVWNNCLVSYIVIDATMWNNVVVGSWRAWHTLFSIKVEVWSWIEALNAFSSIIVWGGAVAGLISLWKLIKSILFDCERVLRKPVRSKHIRYISIFACMVCFIVSNAGHTISRIEIKYSEGWIIGRRTCYTLLMHFTVKWCCFWAEILRWCCSRIANIWFCLCWCRVSWDACFKSNIILISILAKCALMLGWVINLWWWAAAASLVIEVKVWLCIILSAVCACFGDIIKEWSFSRTRFSWWSCRWLTYVTLISQCWSIGSCWWHRWVLHTCIIY